MRHLQWVFSRQGDSSSTAVSAWLDDVYIPAVPDSDGDGVVDSWEYRYFGGLDADLTGDSDGDGIHDAAEGVARTDPTR
jgi:hypothetical protein